MNKIESCFVCNRDVGDKGVLLSMEMTFYSKTAFPTKLMQLLGDEFMVVISEDDKICLRCANLINQTEKLEEDLKQIKTTIMGFLNEKYDLSKEEELSYTLEELQDQKDKNVLNKRSLVDVPNIKPTVVEKYQPYNQVNDTEELSESEATHENYCDVRIKSEPLLNSDHYSNFNSSCNTNVSGDHSISEVCLKKLPGDKLTYNEKYLTLDSCQSKLSKTSTDSEDVVVLEGIKKENVLTDNPMNHLHVSFSANNHLFSINKSPERLVTTYEYKQSHFNENKSKIKSFCDDSSKDLTETVVSNVNLPKEIDGTVSEMKMVCSHNNESKNESRRQTFPSKLVRQNNRKNIKRDVPHSSVKKLRPILPKVSNIKEVLSCVSIVQNSDFIIDNEVVSNRSKYIQSSNSMCSDIINTSTVKPSNNEKGKNLNQQILKGDEQKNFKNENSFKCNFCMKSFKRKISLLHHEASHKGEFAHYCEFCGKGFNKMDKLEEHRVKHTKEERYICDVCGKKFLFQSTYWIHRKWHDNPFPYKCDECNKPFKHSSQLAVHRRRHHTKERPYKCSYCPLTFNVTNTLKRHVMLHTKQYPYKCTLCDQGFTTRFKYTEHLARKHDTFVQKPFIDPKDYKMVVCDNEEKETGVESLSFSDVSQSNSHIQILENTELIFHDNESNCPLGIILPSSMDNNLAEISWLT